jgi:hypothetical protein
VKASEFRPTVWWSGCPHEWFVPWTTSFAAAPASPWSTIGSSRKGIGRAAGWAPTANTREILYEPGRVAGPTLIRADLGTIEPGRLSDFATLTADPLFDSANLREIARVVKGGRRVWSLE